MDEKQMRQIAREEAQSVMRANFNSGRPIVPPHTHDGVNNIKVKQSDIIPSTAAMGKIDFSENKVYTLNFTSLNPTRIDMNGFAFNQSNDSTAFITGMAIVTAAIEFQPATTSSVVQGGREFPINGVLAQCSSNLYVNEGSEDPFPHTDANYIANAFYASGQHVVTAQIVNPTNTSVQIIITNLLAGWTLSANFIIT